jgi:hypothetical protein
MQKINGLEFKVCIEPTRKKRDAPVDVTPKSWTLN